MRCQIIQVDSFAHEPFAGNPAAVCIVPDVMDELWMQNVAAEMNLSETAFVRQMDETDFAIRWFTPTVEVPLCGHATLASAHVLWEEGMVMLSEAVTFYPKQGTLIARREEDWICLEFPAIPVEEVSVPDGLIEALGQSPKSVHKSTAIFEEYLVEMDSARTVRSVQPDFAKLRASGISACVVTAQDETGTFDIVSRFFGPGVGVDEDPVTGVAHCALGPYWADRLGKREFVAHQASKRSGTLRVRVHGDRVDLLGQAITVLRGELLT